MIQSLLYPHRSVLVLSSSCTTDKHYDNNNNDDDQSHQQIVVLKTEIRHQRKQQQSRHYYSHYYYVISCCCYYFLLILLIDNINHNNNSSSGLLYVHAISSFNDQTNDNDNDSSSSTTTTSLQSLLLRKRLYDRIQRSNNNNQTKTDDDENNSNNNSIYNTLQVHRQKQKQIQNRQDGGLFSWLNFVFCRFDTETFVPCWGGFGTIMYEGTKYSENGCIERCVLLPLITPKTYQCGDCGEPTLSPTISIMPSISVAPSKAPVTKQPTLYPPTKKPTFIKIPAPITPAPILIVIVPVPIPSSSFSITLDLVDIPSADQIIFRNAANRWNQIIINDILDVPVNQLNGGPAYDGCKYPSNIIDDLYICAKYENIDGVGTILGSAGPLYSRSGTGLTITGRMRFDSSDINSIRSQGTLPSVILHEMGHVLGIGTQWRSKGLQTGDSKNCPYIGSNVNNEYKTLTGCNVAVPIETDGQPGTICSHWDEKCLKNELMTGFIAQGANNPLSKITIASLKDLGYTSVNMNLADTFTSRDMDSSCICNRRLLEVEEEQQHEIVDNKEVVEEEQKVFFLMNITEQEENDNNNNNNVDNLHHSNNNNNNGKSSLSSSRRRHLLSDESRQTAIQYGLSILNESKIDDDSNVIGGGKEGDNDNNSTDLGYTYVGADVISVLIIENDVIFGVIVHSTDILD